ncbi:MAG: hypothetical protein HC875_31385 [Anaerolineales bacterium]|nr:hypothetical protein [Anaerolineales bacterium]
MQVLTFTIELLEPTLVLMPGSGDANQLESFGYVPGTVLRNVLAAQFIADHQIDDLEGDDQKTEQCRNLFFDDKVRFLNAYPINQTEGRTLPVPLSWQAEKINWPTLKRMCPCLSLILVTTGPAQTQP